MAPAKLKSLGPFIERDFYEFISHGMDCPCVLSPRDRKPGLDVFVRYGLDVKLSTR